MIIAGQSPESKYYNESEDGIPFFQGKADFGELYPTNRVYCTETKKTAEQGDILLSVRAPVGPTNLARETIGIGRGLNAIRPLGGISTRYVLYFFKYIEPTFSKSGTGTTFSAVTVDAVKSLQFPLPPLAEQKRIVEKIDALFSELDKGVEVLQTIRRQLRTYRQAVLKWAFEGNEWEYKPMKSVSQSFGGGAFKSEDFKYDGEHQVIKIGNVRPGVIRLHEKPAFMDSAVGREKYLLKDGDVVITLTGTRKKRDYGYTAIVSIPNLLLNQRVAAIRFNADYLSKFFLYYSWTREFQDAFFKDETGNVGQGNVGMKAITETAIPVCSLTEQENIIAAIESRLSVCDKLEQIVDENIAKSQALRQSILKKAFAGQLVPQDPNDEPADKLLERIKAVAPQAKPARRKRKNA
jgi:type I restriction enzyme S subunit